MRQRMIRTYDSALKILESRRRATRPTTFIDNGTSPPVLQTPTVSFTPTVRGNPSINGMKDWLGALGYSNDHLEGLNIIHVAGTKGKGSTCAFVRSFLLAHGTRTGFPRKVGLYTSPDLTTIRERIQIDNMPIPEEVFAKYFFEVWDKLSPQDGQEVSTIQSLPRYLQLLALTAFHTFRREGTEATIVETHHGGEYDATNIIATPKVTAITSIGMDHVEQLGPSIENVAWHKSGIFKSGALAFSAPQDPAAAAVMQERAAEKRVDLKFVHVDSSLPPDAISIQAPVQKLNCSLAIEMTTAFLKLSNYGGDRQLSAEDIQKGIEQFSWPGRFEILVDGSCNWFLDGAHNELSIGQAAEWFVKCRHSDREAVRLPQILIFTHLSDYRHGPTLLEELARTLTELDAPPDYIIITTYQERIDGSVRPDKNVKVPETSIIANILDTYVYMAKRAFPGALVTKEQSIEGALNFARKVGEDKGEMQCFITGSLHLVGGALHFLRPE